MADEVTCQAEITSAKRHPSTGIACFVISIVAPAFLVLTVVAGGLSGALDKGAKPNPVVIGTIVAVILAYMLVCGVGIGLGIAAVLQKNCKKTLSVFGLVITSVILLIVFLLVVLGRLMDS